MSHFVEVCSVGYVHAQCKCPSREKEVRRVDCPLPADDPHEGYPRWEQDECSPTPLLSSTASDNGSPPPLGLPTASAETREITYSAQVPNVDPPFDVECTMRLARHATPGKPELWSVGVPSSVSTSSRDRRSLPPSVLVKGRRPAEALCRALAINYAIHTGECLRSDQRFRAHTLHYLGEADTL